MIENILTRRKKKWCCVGVSSGECIYMLAFAIAQTLADGIRVRQTQIVHDDYYNYFVEWTGDKRTHNRTGQYLLMPSIRTPWSWGSLGTTHTKRAGVFQTK